MDKAKKYVTTEMMPRLPKCDHAIVWFIVNIIFPGFGSIIAGILDGGDKNMPYNVISGILQILTAPLIIGWIWSIWWGYMIYKRNTGALSMVP